MVYNYQNGSRNPTNTPINNITSIATRTLVHGKVVKTDQKQNNNHKPKCPPPLQKERTAITAIANHFAKKVSETKEVTTKSDPSNYFNLI